MKACAEQEKQMIPQCRLPEIAGTTLTFAVCDFGCTDHLGLPLTRTRQATTTRRRLGIRSGGMCMSST